MDVLFFFLNLNIQVIDIAEFFKFNKIQGITKDIGIFTVRLIFTIY